MYNYTKFNSCNETLLETYVLYIVEKKASTADLRSQRC